MSERPRRRIDREKVLKSSRFQVEELAPRLVLSELSGTPPPPDNTTDPGYYESGSSSP